MILGKQSIALTAKRKETKQHKNRLCTLINGASIHASFRFLKMIAKPKKCEALSRGKNKLHSTKYFLYLKAKLRKGCWSSNGAEDR